MILASLGTHAAPMRELEAVLADWSRREPVVLCSAAHGSPPGVDCRGLVAPSVLRELIREARVVVCHAGPASLHDCWEIGIRPVVIPRSPRRGEHVDDHQERFAARLPSRLAQVVAVSELGRVLAEGRDHTAPGVVDPAFAVGFGRLVDATLARRRRGWWRR